MFKLRKGGSLKPLFFITNYILIYIGLLLCSFLAWNYFGLLFVLFMVMIWKIIFDSNKENFFKSVANFFFLLILWHFGALFWMFGVDKGLYGILSNLLMYLLPFIIFLVIKIKYKIASFVFIPIWLLFEYAINTLSFTFPWLSLGNLFSNQTYLIQWYEITGILGGSFWVMVLSYILYKLIYSKSKKRLLCFLLFLIFPILFSSSINHYRKQNFADKGHINIVTYNNKYNSTIWEKDKLAYHILKKVDSSKKYESLIIPEQTIRGFDGRKIKKSLTYHYFNEYLKKSIVKHIFIGTTGYRNKDTLVNSTIVISNKGYYKKVKKKLVPFTEYLPPVFYPFFKKKFYRGDVLDDLSAITKNINVQPLICYESIYPFFVTKNMGKANQIYITSSEKFMNENPFALMQYDNIVRLRAIENRAPLIKASNYGWSLYIDPFGKIIERKNDEINIFTPSKYSESYTFYKSRGVYLTLPFLLLFFIISLIKLRT